MGKKWAADARQRRRDSLFFCCLDAVHLGAALSFAAFHPVLIPAAEAEVSAALITAKTSKESSFITR